MMNNYSQRKNDISFFYKNPVHPLETEQKAVFHLLCGVVKCDPIGIASVPAHIIPFRISAEVSAHTPHQTQEGFGFIGAFPE